MIKHTFLLLGLAFILSACSNEPAEIKQDNENKTSQKTSTFTEFEFQKSLDSELQNRLLIDMATHVLRKPDAATWQTKFDDEFREFFTKKASELEWLYSINRQDTIYFYLIRDGRDNNGRANRGVGGRMTWDAESQITFFEELFVTKIIDRINLERIGREFLTAVIDNKTSKDFIDSSSTSIEWPDGRLFYSIEKSEWRYVD
jgi:hypothetical protein